MAMYKGKKQKIRGRAYKYSAHYGKKNKAPQFIFTLLLCAALVACGYFLSTPLFEKMSDTDNVLLQSSDVSQNSSSFTFSYEDIVVSKESQVIIPDKKQCGNVYLVEYELYSDKTGLATAIKKAQDGGYDTLMLNIKAQDGILHYNSEITLAIEADAVKNTVDLTGIINQIKASGLSVGIKINVFDEYCIPWHDRNTALLANITTKTLWYDFVTRDITSGSPWLNPLNETAQNYNLEIIKELTQFDIDFIFLDGVHFPVWGRIDAYQLDSNADREKAITEFVSKAKKITKEKGKALGVIVPVCGAVGDYNARWKSYGYPDDIYSLDADAIIVDARSDRAFMQSWYSKITIGTVVIKDLAKATAGEYEAIVNKVNELYLASGSKSEIAIWTYETEATKLPENVNKMIKS